MYWAFNLAKVVVVIVMICNSRETLANPMVGDEHSSRQNLHRKNVYWESEGRKKRERESARQRSVCLLRAMPRVGVRELVS